VLVRQGFEVLEAGSGREALEVWAAHGDRIDLVLTDIMMPGGMTGIDLVEQLRQRRPGLKAVFTSGCRSESSGESVTLDEGDNFIPKPYRPTALVRMLRDQLDAGPA
jgi:CheY-like chemotaxis protein